jgi:hypothetical protein
MATSNNLGDFLTSVANAIRNKKGTTDSINAQNFASEIESIETGGEDKLSAYVDGTLESITIEDLPNADRIAQYCFYNNSSIKSISLHDGIISIGQYAFGSCKALESLNLPNNIISLPNYMCSSCTALTSVVIPESVTLLGDACFQSCTNLTSVTLPSNITKIPTNGFKACGLTSISVPNNVTALYSYAFQDNNNLTSIDLSNTKITDINNYALASCDALSSVILPNTLKYIGPYAFQYDIALKNITLPEGLVQIGDSAFQNASLTSVTIPSTVTTQIGKSAFRMSSLTEAYLRMTSMQVKVTSASYSWFYGCSSSLVLHIPSSVTDPATTYGTRWNYYSGSGTLTYYADL